MKLGDRGKAALGIIFVIALFTTAILFARYIQDNAHIQSFIYSFGYIGILLVALVSGLNLIVPLPATAFVPVFIASGFDIWGIIITLVIGTTFADLTSYYIGTMFKESADHSKIKMVKQIRKYCIGRPFVTQAIVFLYATFAPLPNELLLLPLGTLGVRLRVLFLPFATGNALHITIVSHALVSVI